MKIFIITIFLFCTVGNEQPPESCSDNFPFRLSDRTCDSFNEICFKKEDVQCNQLLNACKQCPPNNITLTILRDIWNMSKFQSNLTKGRMEYKIIEKLSSIEKFLANNLKGYTITILLGTIIIILIIHFVEIRFKLITKFFQLCVKTDMKYSLLKSRKRKHQNEIRIELEAKINQSIENLNEKFELKFQEIIDKIDRLQATSKDKIDRLQATSKDHIQYLQNQPLDTLNRTIKFPLEGIEHKYVELYVHNNHNIVQVKERLCTSLRNAKHDDYKRMKLIYNGQILDDNDYLLKQINPSINSVNYKIYENINTSEIIVVKLKGKMCSPEIIQIHKSESIEKFLITIGNLINTREFRVYKLCIENNEMIELMSDTNSNNKTINDFPLTDGDFLRIVTIERGELRLRSIFNGNVIPTVNYNNNDRVSTFLKDNKMADFILFYPKEKMDEKKFIFQFGISNDSQVKFCDFKKFQGITRYESIYTGNKWEIYFATHQENKKILIKKYNIKSENWKNEEWILKELETFLTTKSHRRFIQLNDVYVDDTSFYVSMEYMTGGTLGYYLKNNKEFDSTQIIKWAAQILEGLNFLHQHKIIHRDLNPSSILVGENNNLKLSSFNLSICNTNGGPSSILGKDSRLCYIKLRYLAPELLDSREYGFQCDVWSFGAVLVRIVTDKKPYPRLHKVEAQNKIINSGKIEYEFPADKFDDRIKSIIDSCFDRDPDSRCTIKKLVENEIIKKSS